MIECYTIVLVLHWDYRWLLLLNLWVKVGYLRSYAVWVDKSVCCRHWGGNLERLLEILSRLVLLLDTTVSDHIGVRIGSHLEQVIWLKFYQVKAISSMVTCSIIRSCINILGYRICSESVCKQINSTVKLPLTTINKGFITYYVIEVIIVCGQEVCCP